MPGETPGKSKYREASCLGDKETSYGHKGGETITSWKKGGFQLRCV